RLSRQDRKRLTNPQKVGEIKEAAYRVMEEAYREVSENPSDPQQRLPANARQIMYKARPLVLALTGGKCWKKSSSFTQGYLPNFIREYPDLTADWDVVFDARGHLLEPHTSHRIGLGTVEVREYMQSWLDSPANAERAQIVLQKACPTLGPKNRYRFA